MLRKIKLYVLTLSCRLNAFYPQLLGLGYWYYKNVFLKKNYKSYDPEEEVLKVVNDAIDNVPYYREKYPNKISSLDEFRRQIKFIDKAEVMANWDSFLRRNIKESRVVMGTTGGTSGKPLKLVIPKNRFVFELGTMYSMWGNVGWKGQIRAVLRNAKLDDNINFKINPLKREFVFDGFRTSNSYYEIVYNTMKSNNIKYLHAYPSSAYQFSVFLKKRKLDTSIFTAFLCGSEGLLPEQENLIETELGIKIYNWYGHSEKLVLGGYCKENNLTHIEPTYGYVELIDKEGDIVTKSNTKGEIVGTTLHNKDMPLLRYRTGDYAEYVGDYCKDCDRSLMLITSIEGRWDSNRIYLKNNRYTSITALNMHGDLYTHINGMQYVQHQPGKLIIKLIKDETYNEDVESRFHDFFNLMLANDCDFEIQYVELIENEKNGKFLPLKQYVNI